MLKKQDNDSSIIYSPCEGEVISLCKVNDETFASEMLGKGISIYPKIGKVFSSFDGKVTMLFPTKHAIGLVNEMGVEILIHIGLDTVELDGKYFRNYVESGDEVKAGDILISFEIEEIKKKGYDIIIPIIVTNSHNYKNVTPVYKEKTILVKEPLLKIESEEA